MTWRTRRLSPGCRNCLAGRGVSLRMTTRCSRECFFCFNPLPRRDAPRLEAAPVRGVADMFAYIRRYRLGGAGISGGDPLTALPRTLAVIRRLRRCFGPRFYIHLYTNGDLAGARTLLRLRRAGLNGIRVNLVANDFNLEPVRRALFYFKDVSVEVPVIPGQARRLKSMMLELEAAGVPFLNLHELCYSPGNRAAFLARGFQGKAAPMPDYVQARPVAGSEETALELLEFAARGALRLSVFYCSWTTQERVINPAGWRWRNRAVKSEPGLRRPRRRGRARLRAGG